MDGWPPCDRPTLMHRDGSITPRDLLGTLEVLGVECDKCGRSGRYRVARLAKLIGADGKLTDWLCDFHPGLPAQAGRKYLGPVRRAMSAARCINE